MVVPYIPGTISFIYLQKWINRAHCAFVDALTTVMTGRINKYRDTSLKEQVNSVLARNSFAVLGDYIGFIHSLASFLLNSVLSLIVIGLLLPMHLLLGYIVSLVICAIVITRLHQCMTVTAEKVEQQHIYYSSLLDKG